MNKNRASSAGADIPFLVTLDFDGRSDAQRLLMERYPVVDVLDMVRIVYLKSIEEEESQEESAAVNQTIAVETMTVSKCSLRLPLLIIFMTKATERGKR